MRQDTSESPDARGFRNGTALRLPISRVDVGFFALRTVMAGSAADLARRSDILALGITPDIAQAGEINVKTVLV
jgi:hypothetical protein